MAKPNLEDGYTRIANELLEAIYKHGFNGYQLETLLLFIRHSYGYGRKNAPLSAEFVHSQLGADKRYSGRIIKTLIEKNVFKIVEEATPLTPRVLEINKNWEEWGNCIPRNKNTTVVENYHTTVEQDYHTTVVEDYHHKRNIKEKIKKDIYSPTEAGRAKVSPKDHISEGNPEGWTDWKCFEFIYDRYPKKEGKAKAWDYYRGYKSKSGRVVSGEKIRLTDKQILKAVDYYADKVYGKDREFIMQFSRFMNKDILDYLGEAEREEDV